jgi:hypothetical protein
MLRTLALLCAVSGTAAGAVELTPDNYDKEMGQGKAAFIKFLAPW